MKEVKTKAGTFTMQDRPITDDWDMLCAIAGAHVEIEDAVKEIFLTSYGNKGNVKDMLKVADAVFGNLLQLIRDYSGMDKEELEKRAREELETAVTM